MGLACGAFLIGLHSEGFLMDWLPGMQKTRSTKMQSYIIEFLSSSVS